MVFSNRLYNMIALKQARTFSGEALLRWKIQAFSNVVYQYCAYILEDFYQVASEYGILFSVGNV